MANGENVETSEPTTRKVSEREFIGASGEALDEGDEGIVGVRYTSLTEDFAETVLFSDVPENIRNTFLGWGMLTRMGNWTNTVRNSKPGANVAESERAAIENGIGLCKQGLWVSPRGEAEAGTTILAEAIVRAKASQEGKEVALEDAAAYVRGLSKEEKSELRKRPAIKMAIREIQAERSAAKATADDVADIAL